MVARAIVLATCCIVAIPTAASANETPSGLSVSLGGGINASSPFARLRLAYRLADANEHLEPYLEYGYNSAISFFPFSTFMVGTHIYFCEGSTFRPFLRMGAGVAISSAGDSPVSERSIGERLMGLIFLEGLGVQIDVMEALSITAAVSTGYPVFVRPELGLKYAF